MKELTELAIKAALMAGDRIMEIYENESFDVDFKSDESPLTKADIASHNIIVKELEKMTYPILSEEGKSIPYEKRKEWDKLWIVDPIDGTKEFIKKNGEFTVNIAFVENGVPTIGVIYVPAQDILYFANPEIGAYKKVKPKSSMKLGKLVGVSNRMPIEKDRSVFTIVASRSHLSKETEDFIKEMKMKHGKVETISKGSSLKLCMVAEGVADCYPRFAPTMEWDTAAGNAICSAVGLHVIDKNTNNELIYNKINLTNLHFIVN